MSSVALITGASGGVGRSCAIALANSKIKLALQYNKKLDAAQGLEKELRNSGAADVRLFQADLTVAADAGNLTAKIATELGEPTILIHAAGQFIEKPLAFTKPEDWDALINLHAVSAALISKAMLRYLRKTEHGRVVLIGSMAGVLGLGNAGAYAAAKGALQGLCKCLALETARWKTTVNLIAPGYIDTEMTAGHDSARREEILKSIPLGRYAKAGEIAALAAFLCSPQAAYITGQILQIDGGLSL